MLADEITITTRRNQLCGDDDGGWMFTTTGIGSFGELRRQTHRLRGTEVRLQIKKELVPSDTEFENRVLQYLKETLVRVPCRVRFIGLNQTTNWDRGWTRDPSILAERILSAIQEKASDDLSGELISSETRTKRLSSAKLWQEIELEMREKLRWHVVQGELPKRMGMFRAHMPYFELSGGPCLAFLRVTENDSQREVESMEGADYIEPEPTSTVAWKGMRSAQRFSDIGNFFLEIDWTSEKAGEISVNRWDVKSSTEANIAKRTLADGLRKELIAFISKHKQSVYETLNSRLANASFSSGSPYWLQAEGDSRHWAPVQFPASSSETPQRRYSISNRVVQVPARLHAYEPPHNYKWIGWPSYGADPDRMVALARGRYLELMPIFDAPGRRSSQPFVGSAFPPEWGGVLGVRVRELYGWTSGVFVWNQNSFLVGAFSRENWRAVAELFKEFDRVDRPKFNPLTNRDQLINDRAFLANFLGQLIMRNLGDHWCALLESDEEVRDAVGTLFQASGFREHYCDAEGYQRWVRVSSCGWEAIERDTWKIKELLSKPSDEWLVAVSDKSENRLFRGLAAAGDPWNTPVNRPGRPRKELGQLQDTGET